MLLSKIIDFLFNDIIALLISSAWDPVGVSASAARVVAMTNHWMRASSMRVTIRAWLMWPKASMSDQRTGTCASKANSCLPRWGVSVLTRPAYADRGLEHVRAAFYGGLEPQMRPQIDKIRQIRIGCPKIAVPVLRQIPERHGPESLEFVL